VHDAAKKLGKDFERRLRVPKVGSSDDTCRVRLCVSTATLLCLCITWTT